MREYIVNDTAVAVKRSFRNSIYRVRSRFPYAVQSVKGSSCISTIRSFSFCVFQASTANDKTTAPRRLVETGPSVCRWRTATSARVHPALPDRIARTTSTNATGTRADMAPARTFTDRTSKSNDIVNGPLPILYVSSFNVNCPFPRNHDATRFSANLFHDFVGPPSSFLLRPYFRLHLSRSFHRQDQADAHRGNYVLRINFYHRFAGSCYPIGAPPIVSNGRAKLGILDREIGFAF